MNKELLSPAKINLGLKVHHKRPADGYHYISSIFIPVSWGDTIRIYLPGSAEERPFFLTTENLLTGKSYEDFEQVSERGDVTRNLLWKAMDRIRTSTNRNFHVHLIKKIPTGAGLGGGSSNAGVILRELGGIFSLDQKWLEETALSLGADVPFFLFNKPALVTGIGEILSEIPEIHGFGVLCMPGIPVNTKKAYADLKRTLQNNPPPLMWSALDADALSSLAASDWENLSGLQNDFEEVVFTDHPLLAQIKSDFLSLGAAYASMSGSGSAVYCICSTQQSAMNVMHSAAEKYKELHFESFRF